MPHFVCLLVWHIAMGEKAPAATAARFTLSIRHSDGQAGGGGDVRVVE